MRILYIMHCCLFSDAHKNEEALPKKRRVSFPRRIRTSGRRLLPDSYAQKVEHETDTLYFFYMDHSVPAKHSR